MPLWSNNITLQFDAEALNPQMRSGDLVWLTVIVSPIEVILQDYIDTLYEKMWVSSLIAVKCLIKDHKICR